MAAGQITDVEREAFKKAFDEFDVNKDGHITSSELKTVLKKLGQNPTDQEIADFIKACDVDKNGTIEFGEFCRYLVDLRRKIFNEIDADGNGYITPEEVCSGFKKFGVDLTMDDAKAIVKGADTDGDGRVSYNEFVKAMQNRPIC